MIVTNVTSLFYLPIRVSRFVAVASILMFVCLATLSRAQSVSWRGIPGAAIDVGVGANGAVWVIGYEGAKPDQRIFRWNGSSFTPAGGSGVRIAVDPAGNPWVVNSVGDIYRSENNASSFIKMPGKAIDIGIGANGIVWIVGINVVPGGYGIYRWTGTEFVGVPGGGVRISVDPQGYAWIVDSALNIYRFDGSAFVRMPGQAKDIGIGGDGSVFIAGGNDAVYKWNGVSAWVQLDGSGLIAVAADGAGNPWGVNAGRNIYAGTNTNVAPALSPEARLEMYAANRRTYGSSSTAGILHNPYTSRYVWYTLYAIQLVGRTKVASGCLPPNSYTYKEFPTYDGKTAFKILYEVKEGSTCNSGNVCATDSERTIENNDFRYPTIGGNGSSCYIAWNLYPPLSFYQEHPLLRATFHPNL